MLAHRLHASHELTEQASLVRPVFVLAIESFLSTPRGVSLGQSLLQRLLHEFRLRHAVVGSLLPQALDRLGPQIELGLNWSQCRKTQVVMASVVVAGLQEVDAILTDQVHDAVLLRQTPRPGPRREILEGLRLPDSLKRIAQDRLDQIERSQRDTPVGLDPVPQVFAKLPLKDCCASAAPLSLQAPALA